MGIVIFDGVAYGMLLFLIGVGLSVTMGLMLCAIVWQSNIIGNQRDVIQWLWSTKFGG